MDNAREYWMGHFLGHALSAESGIDFRIASEALDAYQEITDMANAARREIDDMLGFVERCACSVKSDA